MIGIDSIIKHLLRRFSIEIEALADGAPRGKPLADHREIELHRITPSWS